MQFFERLFIPFLARLCLFSMCNLLHVVRSQERRDGSGINPDLITPIPMEQLNPRLTGISIIIRGIYGISI